MKRVNKNLVDRHTTAVYVELIYTYVTMTRLYYVNCQIYVQIK